MSTTTSDVLQHHVTLNGDKIVGGNGYITDFLMGRIMQNWKLYEIGVGASEGVASPFSPA